MSAIPFFLLFLVIPRFQLQFISALELDKDCKKQCDSHRELGKVFGFVLECSDAKDADKCVSECDKCPNFVCLKDKETKPNDVKYNCPVAQLIGFDDCRELCEKHRRDEEEEYILTCNDHYDKSTCDSLCTKCPSYVCDSKAEDNLIYCTSKDDTFFPRNSQSRQSNQSRSAEEEHLKATANWYRTSTFILAVVLVLVIIASGSCVAVIYWKLKSKSAAGIPTAAQPIGQSQPERPEKGQKLSVSAPAILASIGAFGDKKN